MRGGNTCLNATDIPSIMATILASPPPHQCVCVCVYTLLWQWTKLQASLDSTYLLVFHVLTALSFLLLLCYYSRSFFIFIPVSQLGGKPDSLFFFTASYHIIFFSVHFLCSCSHFIPHLCVPLHFCLLKLTSAISTLFFLLK